MPATALAVWWPLGVAVGPDGSVYIADAGNSQIRRVGHGRDHHRGCRYTIPGGGDYGGDGGLATDAKLNSPRGVAIGRDGSIYIADYGNNCVRRVRLRRDHHNHCRRIRLPRNSCPATSVMAAPRRRHVLASTRIRSRPGWCSSYRGSNNTIEFVCWSTASPGLQLSDILIASEDGTEVYVFNGRGRHKETRSTLANAVLYKFDYDNGHLSKVTDRDGYETKIGPDASGNLTITAPFGQKTTLKLNSNNYLRERSDPGNNALAVRIPATVY